MKKILFSIIFLTLVIDSYSQDRIDGKIQNVENNEPIPFVNIGVFEKKVGTVSNDKGYFSLNLNETVNLTDTISFSIVGFKQKKILLSDFDQNNNTILLEPKVEELDEVVLSDNRQKIGIIGRNKEGRLSSKFFSPFDKSVDDNLSREKGMVFTLEHSSRIQDVNFHVSLNEFKDVKLRLNFYTVENSLPDKLLNTEDIIINIKDGYLGWVKFDLEPYNIVLDKSLKEVAVTLQWIASEKKSKDSERFGITATNSIFKRNSLFRDKGMSKWIKWKQNLSLYLTTEY